MSIEDDTLEEVIEQYKQATQLEKQLAHKKERLKDRIIQLTGQQPFQGHGIRLQKIKRKGSVSYRKAFESIEGFDRIDLSPFTGAESISWTIKELSND